MVKQVWLVGHEVADGEGAARATETDLTWNWV